MEAAFHENNYFFTSIFRRKRLCPSILDGTGYIWLAFISIVVTWRCFYITFHSLAVACISIVRMQVTNGMHRVLYRIKLSPPTVDTVSM
jgi:hypothetical protein